MREGGVLVGIDGGASRTRGVAITAADEALARADAGGSAIIGAPRAEACAVLRSVLDSLCSQGGFARDDIALCGLGLNGVDFEDEFPVQHAGIAEALGIPSERLVLVNDGIVALWGASAAPAAAILHHGSGITSAYRSAYGQEKLFDHLDAARTFDMRHELVSVVARMLNGMVEDTPLKAKALAHFGIADESRYPEAVFRRQIPREKVLSTPPFIYQAWLDGDGVAAALVEAAADDYALTAKAMIACTGSSNADATFGGGVINCAPPPFWTLLAERVHRHCPDVAVKPPDLAAEFGAAIMAGYHVGLDPVALFGRLREVSRGRQG
jgi:N-acetylglucosamine kinase-like BadF-type ATPase